MLEQKMLIKLAHLQRNFRELSEREAKLSQDKLDLSKERMEMQALRKQQLQSRCSLCKIGEKSKELSNILTNVDTEKLTHKPYDFATDIDVAANSLLNDPTGSSIDFLLDASLNRMHRMGRQVEIDLTNIPEITDISDNLLDPDLQMVKLDALTNRY